MYVQHDPFLVLMFLMIKNRETEHSRVHFRIGFAARSQARNLHGIIFISDFFFILRID